MSIRTRLRLHALTTTLLLAAMLPAQAGTVRFTRVPTVVIFTDLEVRGGTKVRGLIDKNQAVGTFGERNWVILGMPHAFIYNSNGFGTGPLTPDGSFGRWGPESFRLGRIEGELYADTN